MAVLGLVVAAGAVVAWVLWPRPVALAVDGLPIGNAADVLVAAESRWQELAEADGVAAPDGAGCWFAPAAEDDHPSRVACGPALFGIAQQGEPWLVADVRYRTSGEAATGGLRSFTGVAVFAAGDLAHPDGRDVPEDVTLSPPAARLRAPSSARVIEPPAVLDDVDATFSTLADEEGATAAPRPNCFLGIAPGGADTRASDEQIWCGPVRPRGAGPEPLWADVGIGFRATDDVTAVTASPLSRIGSASELRVGTTLWRPDGATPRAWSSPPPNGTRIGASGERISQTDPDYPLDVAYDMSASSTDDGRNVIGDIIQDAYEDDAVSYLGVRTGGRGAILDGSIETTLEHVFKTPGG